ncbi:MAG: hypothetical protein QNJ34_13870 [Xenococcaceae cyanobacterium MO_188.B29]|nr:hypothetical protein [Xenococcaceae cyanobacterium MO_188.B29]
MTKVLFIGCFDDSRANDKYKLIKQLLIEAQEQEKLSVQRNLILLRIVNIVLLMRPICRKFNGQPLDRVYQELYDSIKGKLLQEISKELTEYNPSNIVVSEWVKRIQNQVFKQVLNDEQLKKLGIEAQKYPPKSALRGHALTELIRSIQLSGKLYHPHQEKFPAQLYQLLYEEALTETLTYICLNIDKYDPNRGNKKFMNWVNFRLDRLIFDCYRRFNYLPDRQLPSLQDIEQIYQQERQPFLSELIYQYIEEDTDNVFKSTHIRNNQNANFQNIALARFSGQNWEQISEELDISISTLSSFFQRCCQRFASLLQEELQE